MQLNRIEKILVNNKLREWVQRKYEAPKLVAMGGPMNGGLALEVGCGRGIGIELILQQFGANRVDAFDLDPNMVRLAQRRLEPYGSQVNVWTGDLTAIRADDETYDAVFDFGVVHHVPAWRDAVKEIFRVLKGGGRFYGTEVYKALILHPIWRRLLAHPLEDRFDHDTFCASIQAQGFRMIATHRIRNWFGWFVVEKAIQQK